MQVPAKAAFEVFSDVRGMVTFFLFIMEEAAQTAGMSAYMAFKAGLGAEAKAHAQWCISEVLTPAQAFNQSVGVVAYPMNEAFSTFYAASKKSMDFYLNNDPPRSLMAGSSSWLQAALRTLSSQWHFHMDLLNMWKNEMAAVSLGLFVMKDAQDPATYRRLLAWYEQVIRYFIFDTGYEPLVSVYDGEIRSNPLIYDFFSKDPMYLAASTKYYNSKLEDVNTQFTEQFVGNLATFWGLIIPDIYLHALSSSAKDLFDSRANHVLAQRFVNHASQGDFFKWCSHAWSVAYKNYTPFVASPELWRIYNPLIDLYYVTIASHIRCYSALKSTFESQILRPFIPNQLTRITVNGAAYGTARLNGDGIINVEIPRSDLPRGENIICFDTYGLKSCVTNLRLYQRRLFNVFGVYDLEISETYKSCERTDLTGPVTFSGEHGGYNTYVNIGYYFWNPDRLKIAVTVEADFTPVYNYSVYTYWGWPRIDNYEIRGDSNDLTPNTPFTWNIPPLEFFRVFISSHGEYSGGPFPPVTLAPFKVSVLPDDFPMPGWENFNHDQVGRYCRLETWP